MSPRVSIIIVNYKSGPYLDKLLASIEESKFKDYEIIIVDNDSHNIGYGAGINSGARKAKGDYLFVLNPDTLVFPDTISKLVSFLDKYPLAGIVAPLLLDSNHRPYPLQGSRELTPLSIIFAQSIVHKIWPTNSVARHYWLMDWDKSSIQQVGVIPGTAFMIRKSVFQEVGGFDPHFFLYFEESDLCRRVSKLGWQIYMLASSRLIHFWGKSTPDTPQTKRIFAASRLYYFQKHFGHFSANTVEFFTSISKTSLIASTILFLGILLRIHALPANFHFFGDSAWFYLSARDALLSGRFPIAGITSSITWLHQGPLWTYLLVPVLWLGNFHPASGAILAVLTSILSLILFYFLTRNLLATLIFALNPFLVWQASVPYHTTPVPLFMLVFFASLKLRRYSIAALFLGFLYQLHLLTFLLWPILLIKSPRVKTSLFFFLGCLPFVLSGPSQLFGVIVWVFKSALSGFSGSTISDAYLMTASIPALLLLAWILKRLPKTTSFSITLTILVFYLFNHSFPYRPSYQANLRVARIIHSQTTTSSPVILSTGLNSQFATTKDPYVYLVWWLSRANPPTGQFSTFLVNETTKSVKVLE